MVVNTVLYSRSMNIRREYPPIFTHTNSHEYGVNTA